MIKTAKNCYKYDTKSELVKHLVCHIKVLCILYINKLLIYHSSFILIDYKN